MDTLSEIYKETTVFFNTYIDCYGAPWSNDSKLPEIIDGCHGKWISFKNYVRNKRTDICDNLIVSVNNRIAVQLTSLIISKYAEITRFINGHRTEIPEEKVNSQSREGIALELRFEMYETIDLISKLCPEIEIPELGFAETDSDPGINDAFLTDKGMSLLTQLVEIGYLERIGENRYQWLKTARLYGYFVDQCSDYLSMRDSNERTPWRYFKTLIINHDKLEKGAKQGVDEYKNRDLSKPEGYEAIYKICHPSS